MKMQRSIFMIWIYTPTQNTFEGVFLKYALNNAVSRLVGGQTSLSDFFIAQKPFVGLKEAQKYTLYSLLTLDMQDILSNSMLKCNCIASGTSVAGTRKWCEAPWKYSLAS